MYSESLRAGRSGHHIPVVARFSTPVQNVLWAHASSYTKRTVSFPAAKRHGRDVDHPSPSSAEVKERVELYLYFPSGHWRLFYSEIYFIGVLKPAIRYT
jgi:hypothetical protein